MSHVTETTVVRSDPPISKPVTMLTAIRRLRKRWETEGADADLLRQQKEAEARAAAVNVEWRRALGLGAKGN